MVEVVEAGAIEAPSYCLPFLHQRFNIIYRGLQMAVKPSSDPAKTFFETSFCASNIQESNVVDDTTSIFKGIWGAVIR